MEKYIFITREQHRDIKKIYMLIVLNSEKINRSKAEHIMHRCLTRGYKSALSLLNYYIDKGNSQNV